MIRYCCDLCKRELDPEEDLHFVVKIEAYAAFDPMVADEDGDDRNHLQEIQDILEQLDDAETEYLDTDVYQQFRFDLCAECHKKFMKNPLGRETAKQFHFSQN